MLRFVLYVNGYENNYRHHLEDNVKRRRKSISFVWNQFRGVRDKVSERFKVNRLLGKGQICFIGYIYTFKEELRRG